MHQINEQSPSKTTSTCFQCHQLGHWASDCPQSPNFRTPSTINRSPISVFPSSSSDYPPTHCRCGAGFCEIRVSNSEKNPNREYYCCPGKFEYYCNYFKWCDNLKKEEILEVQPKPFPVCACGAGICSVKVEESGANAGRSCFVCPIKKGCGACNFRQWVDDFPDSLLEEDEELEYWSPEAFTAIDAVVSCALDLSTEEDRVQKNGMDGLPDVANKMLSGSPEPRLHSLTDNSLEKFVASGLKPEDDELLLITDDFKVDTVEESINTVVSTPQTPISRASFNPLNIPNDKSPSEVSLDLNELLPKQSVVLQDDVFEALGKLSLCLQKDFISKPDFVGPKKHTFAPLDYLRVDYGLFHLQVMDYIKQATAHACIEQAIKDDATSRETVDRYQKEKARFEETFRSFCEAVKAYMVSNDRLISFREKVSCARKILDELEEEEWCCEVENAGYKENLLHVSKTMSECKESMQAAYQEVEDALELLNRR